MITGWESSRAAEAVAGLAFVAWLGGLGVGLGAAVWASETQQNASAKTKSLKECMLFWLREKLAKQMLPQAGWPLCDVSFAWRSAAGCE